MRRSPSYIELPYLDPAFTPEHPANHMPKPEEYEFYPFPVDTDGRAAKRRNKEWLEKALDNWVPPHVIRAWETDEIFATKRSLLLSMILTPRLPTGYEDLGVDDAEVNKMIRENIADERPSFRRFAHAHLHLSEHRFHASHGEPHIPSEEEVDIMEEDICWIMEYSERECNTIRRQIAHEMGVFPATTEPDSIKYDEEIAWRYDRRLYVRCRRRHKKCIRPSHIVVFTSSFKDLP